MNGLSPPSASPEACRADVWLWRARFFKTRAVAARFLERAASASRAAGAAETRLDKASRTLRAGDELVFALGPRLVAVRVKAAGERRGPACEAQGLYEPISPQESSGPGDETSRPL